MGLPAGAEPGPVAGAILLALVGDRGPRIPVFRPARVFPWCSCQVFKSFTSGGRLVGVFRCFHTAREGDVITPSSG